MKRALFVCLALRVAQPAFAQTRVYVSGDLFAEITRMSRTTVTPENLVQSSSDPVDGVTAGGGARLGAFFSPEWSLELGEDLGRTMSHVQTRSVPIAITLGFPLPAPPFQARTSSRFSATSVLVGYHPPARGRVRAGFRGGLSLMRTERTSTIGTATVVLAPFSPLPSPVSVPTLSVLSTEVTTIVNGLTATLAAEAAIEASRHFAVVPEMRVHAGGLNGFVLRPGVSARWLW
jgi:hypothetical protein